MAETIETSERGPWRVPSVLEQLDQIGVFDAQEIRLRCVMRERRLQRPFAMHFSSGATKQK